ncbi:MAG TPA: AbrB/MazE/SpoVT family DNA-binding domain-containing protein [Actinomycetota bacterium]
MRTTIDGAGRVVIPKSVRDELGLRPGEEIEVSLRDGHIEIEAVPASLHLEERGGIVVAEPEERLPPLTVEEVRAALERVRR